MSDEFGGPGETEVGLATPQPEMESIPSVAVASGSNENVDDSSSQDTTAPDEASENEVYLAAQSQRDESYRELESQMDQLGLSDEQVSARFAIIDSKFMGDLARPLVSAGEPLTFAKVEESLQGKQDIPKPIQQAKLEIVSESVQYLESQGYIQNGKITEQGIVALSEISSKWGITITENTTAEELQLMISENVPFELVIAKFSGDAKAEKAFMEEMSHSNVGVAPDEDPKESDIKGEQTDSGSEGDKSTPARSNEKKVSRKAKVWNEIKGYVAESAQDSDAVEFMNFMFGIDTRGGHSGHSRQKENDAELLSGEQVGEAHIKEATEDGQEKHLLSLFIAIAEKLTPEDVQKFFGIDSSVVSTVKKMTDGEFRQFSQEQDLKEKVEAVFNNSQTTEVAFQGFKDWLTTRSNADSAKKLKWKENLSSTGFTKNAFEKMVEYYGKLSA